MLDTVEIAFAAIDEVDKLQYILHIKDMPSAEGVAAELALFRRRPEEAEQILLSAGLHYRAIKLNIKSFNWERALDLASRNSVPFQRTDFWLGPEWFSPEYVQWWNQWYAPEEYLFWTEHPQERRFRQVMKHNKMPFVFQ